MSNLVERFFLTLLTFALILNPELLIHKFLNQRFLIELIPNFFYGTKFGDASFQKARSKLNKSKIISMGIIGLSLISLLSGPKKVLAATTCSAVSDSEVKYVNATLVESQQKNIIIYGPMRKKQYMMKNQYCLDLQKEG